MLILSCPSWQWHRTGYSWSPFRILPVAALWCDLGRCSRTVVVIKLRRTSAFNPGFDSSHQQLFPVTIAICSSFVVDTGCHSGEPCGFSFKHVGALKKAAVCLSSICHLVYKQLHSPTVQLCALSQNKGLGFRV